MNDLPGTLEQLSARLEMLEERVSALEHSPASSAASPALDATAFPASNALEDLSFTHAGSIFPLLGRAMLGIAGAYLLRAVAESTSLPKLAVAAIAIAYAVTWLVWAVRTQTGTWVPGAIYAGTSSLILAPMLWELTLSFKVLPPTATAAILGAFVVAASALAWKRDCAPVVWVTYVAAAGTALALAIATRDLIPFIAALLLMALICEYAVLRRHQLSVRILVAAAANLAAWALIFIYSSPQSTRADYPEIAAPVLLLPGCILFFIYAASASMRTTLLAQNITVFETLQSIVAFLLAASSALYFEPQFGAVGLGVACLLLSALCYALVLAVFREPGAGRNFQVFAAWATGLLFTGSMLCLPPLALALCVGGAAVALTLLGVRLQRLTLQIHGQLLLLAGAIASGLFGYASNALAGTEPARLTASVCVLSVCVLGCYAIGKSASADDWVRQAMHFVGAALAVGILAAFIVQALLSLVTLRIAPEAHHVACIRTLTLCALALAAAFAGSRWRRADLTRIAYAALVFIAAKLVFEDLRHGHLGFIAASIFLFAITLIAVPRLARISRKA